MSHMVGQPQPQACPKCGCEVEAAAAECPRCQVVFAKLHRAEEHRRERQEHPSRDLDHLHRLAETQDLVVRQLKEMLEIFTGLECKNQYQVMDGTGQPLFMVAEQGEGLGELLVRWFLKAARPFTMLVHTPEGVPVLTLRRPFRFFFHRIDVSDAGGTPLGHIEKRFSLLRRRYDLFDAESGRTTEIVGPVLKPWTFQIMMGGEPVGAITKKWSGLLKEAFSDADNFGVSFPPQTSVRRKAVILGAVFLIDTVHFENNG